MATQNKMPRMYPTDTLIQAGIDPQTGLPIKMGSTDHFNLKTEVKKQLRILDEQDAVNRFTWYNLPKGLNSKLMERILYYRGQGMFFKLGEEFYFLPYCLDGTIDVYGRFTGVTPLPFNGNTSTTKDGKQKVWVQGLVKKPVYDTIVPEEYFNEDGTIKIKEFVELQDNACVLIKDYTEQLAQTNISRQILQDTILDTMADMFPFMRTALLNSTGIQGVRVTEQSEQANVEIASRAVNQAALEGRKYIAMVGGLNFQDLAGGDVAKAEEYLLAMQSLDNYRLSLYGLDNGGLFQKKSHMLEAEQSMNTGNTGLVLQDSLKCRQDACAVINSVWGLNVWVKPSEPVMNIDRDGDGEAGGEEENFAQSSQDTEEETTNE